MTQTKPVVVVGDGWAALSAVGTLVTAEGDARREVRWIVGPGSRVLAPLPSLESSTQGYGAVEALVELASKLGMDLGQEHTGNFLREFKNKAFREPVWTKSDDLAERKQSREESLWDPERSLVNLFETRFDLSLAEIEEQIRAKLTSLEFKNLRRIEGNDLVAVRIQNDKVRTVVLASGEEIECESVIYADRWSALAKIQGLPKSLAFARHRDPHGVLQATFTHAAPVGVGVLEGFFGTMNRESGEDFDRHVWGYFSSDGLKSYWMICLSSDEVEDNHEIAKKLRRMKSTLDKMFVGTDWSPQGEEGFMANVRDEQVRFEESFIAGSGEVPTEVTEIKGVNNLWFLTDGYGPSCSFQQVKLLLNPDATNSQSKDVNVSDAAQL
jgi:hypothetical protein